MIDKITNRLDELIKKGDELKEKHRNIHGQHDKEREVSVAEKLTWSLSSQNLLRKIGLNDFLKEFTEILEGRAYPSMQIGELVAVLKSAQDEIAAGFVYKIEHLLHADLFNSVIDQADALLKAGHKIPAAVLGRIVVERWLSDLADQNGIQTQTSDKPSIVNDKLKTNNIFSQPKWRQVQVHLDVGNEAAHGHDDKFEISDVENMIQFIKSNCF